jgi:hypothetical protein
MATEINAGKYEHLRRYIIAMTKEERSSLLITLTGWFSNGPYPAGDYDPYQEFWCAVEQLTMVDRAAGEVEQEGRPWV